MRRWIWIVGIVVLLGITLLFLRGDEDSWLRFGKNGYQIHGKAIAIPDFSYEQNESLKCAYQLYSAAMDKYGELNSECIGKCGDYSVDIVHYPRIKEDDLPQNQCSDFANGITTKFIEMNNYGDLIRISG